METGQKVNYVHEKNDGRWEVRRGEIEDIMFDGVRSHYLINDDWVSQDNCYEPQGDDVISEIVTPQETDGLKKLRSLVNGDLSEKQINEMIQIAKR